MKYPIGIQNFDKIRREGYVYVDKTARIFQLVQNGSYYFLSRPRRFGKSLLISTMEAYFRGQRELFEGLAIAELEQEWKTYPVLHLDLNSREYKDESSLVEELNRHLEEWESLYGDEYRSRAIEERFLHIVSKAYEQTGERVVILVDEYDKPLLQSIGNEPLQSAYRSTLKAFYSVLKTQDRYIKFAFLTGVTKFGKVSVFSDLNNLEDISMLEAYTDICGVSEDELHSYFDDEVDALSQADGITKAECYEKLRQNYDGYHFKENAPGIYNPFSLLNTLKNRQFSDYWFETGTPTLLVEVLKRTHYPLENLTKESIDVDTLNSIDMMDENPLPLIYQSGYLTIKSYNKRFYTYTLDYPNEEVRRGFTRFLLPYYLPVNKAKSYAYIENFVSEIESGDAEGFMSRLQTLFAAQNYQIAGDVELYFHNAVSLIFQMLGLFVQTEVPTSDGRIDVVIQTKDYVYIIELKLDQSADEALRQIEAKQYARPFAGDGRRIYKIGVNFSSATRAIEEYKIEENGR